MLGISPPASYDVVVVGGGPAGHSAAVRAAGRGARVALVERGDLGGACLNWACVPTKFLRHATDILAAIASADRYGISASLSGVSWAELKRRQQTAVDTMRAGASDTLAASHIEVLQGEARLTSPREVAVRTDKGSLRLAAKNIILASGSVPIKLKIPGAELALSAPDLMRLEKLPASLAIVGGGAVGTELASIFAALGCRVSLIEMMPQILPAEDGELTAVLARALQKEGISVYTATSVSRIEGGTLKRLTLSSKDGERTLETETVAVAIGQRPNYEGLGLVELGVKCGKGGIEVDERLATCIPGVYAAGDVTGKAMLAYVAMMQGRVAADNATGHPAAMDYRAVPRCVFSQPELAGLGLTEAEARTRGYPVRVGRSAFAANAAATISGQRQGLVKLICEQDSGKLLGVHVLGPETNSLIAEATLAIQLGASARDLAGTLHVHPTLSEALWEAALNAESQAQKR